MTAGPEPGRAPFWPRRSPAFLSARRAVRAALSDAAPRGVVVGLSGGADSLALTAACIAEVAWPPDAGARTPNARGSGGADGADGAHGTGANVAPVHAVVVDHGLQEGSAAVAEKAATTARGLGATAEIIRVDVPGGGDGAGEGPEAAARTARHAALHGAALRLGRPLLLAHTLDDQAETVLLGLARGAGATALSGMDPDRTWDDGVRVVRPLLGLRRADTEAVCDELGLEPWHDPHNADPRFARVRARATALPMLEELLGPGIAENLARTADLLRADARALDALADDALRTADELDVGDVVTLPDAVRTRVLKNWAEANGSAPLAAAHVTALDKLVGDHRGRGPVALPSAETPGHPGSRLVAHRKGGTLAVSRGFTAPPRSRSEPRSDPK